MRPDAPVIADVYLHYTTCRTRSLIVVLRWVPSSSNAIRFGVSLRILNVGLLCCRQLDPQTPNPVSLQYYRSRTNRPTSREYPSNHTL